MRSKRVFIGLKLSPDWAAFGFKLQSQWNVLPAKWVNTEDLHLTLLPPWEMKVEDESKVVGKIKEGLTGTQPFEIRLKTLELGPEAKNPRFIWILCTNPPELFKLKMDLEVIFGSKEEFDFLPHITLGRIGKKDQKVWENKRVRQVLNQPMRVNSIELFESHAEKEPKYSVLGTFTFEEPRRE